MRNPSKSSSAGVGVGSAANKAATPCCSKVGMKRGPWTPQEDELLSNYINRDGEGRWRTLPKRAGLLRCGKSCRLRWMNYLRPSVKRGHISPDEEDLILRLHRLLGNRWSLIAGRIPGRTDNDIKNYWNTHLSKKLISQGIDPRTHRPLNPNYSTSDDNNNKPSSSKPNHISNPNPNYNNNIPSPASEDQPMVTGGRLIGDNGNDYGGASINQNQSTQEDDDINYCTDDVFSSFMNSLINEDFFKGSGPVFGSDSLISSNLPMFTFGAGWDAPIMSSGSAFNQNEPKRLNEHVEKHF